MNEQLNKAVVDTFIAAAKGREEVIKITGDTELANRMACIFVEATCRGARAEADRINEKDILNLSGMFGN